MFGIKQIGIKIGGIVMLGIFASIFTTNLLCNLAHAVDATGVEHDHPYGHDHHHDTGPPVAEHNHKDKGHEHEHDQDSSTDCCSEFSITFFSSLQRHHIQTAKLNSKVITSTLLFPAFSSPMTKNMFLGWHDYIQPFPAIPDIRIFIQSFQV